MAYWRYASGENRGSGGFALIVCGAPVLYVDGSLLQGLNGKFDRIACFHMSGLWVRSHVTAGQDG